MAKLPKDYIRILRDELSPKLADAFLTSIEGVTSELQINTIAKLISEGKVTEIVQALNIDLSQFDEVDLVIREGFHEGGRQTVLKVPVKKSPDGINLKVRFNVRNPRAEAWLAERSGTLIREITREQLTVIRGHITDGMVRGDNPRTVARRLAGFINKTTGKREGGVIGLTAKQRVVSQGNLDDLLSGDPERLAKTLTRGLRDKRFDGTVRRAIRDGKPLPKNVAEKIAQSYNNRLLKFRADAIARTEMSEALHQAQSETWLQAVEQDIVDANTVTRIWFTAGDERVRETHALIPQMNPEGRGLEELFDTPDGAFLHPPAGPLCRCYLDVDVDFLAGIV